MAKSDGSRQFKLQQIAFEDRLQFIGAWVEWSRLQVLAQFAGLTPDQRDEWESYLQKLNRIHTEVFGVPAYMDPAALRKLWRE